MPSKVTHLRARNAALRRDRPPTDPEVIKNRQQLKAAVAEDFLRKLLSEPPALTPEQRFHLSQLLRRGRA